MPVVFYFPLTKECSFVLAAVG